MSCITSTLLYMYSMTSQVDGCCRERLVRYGSDHVLQRYWQERYTSSCTSFTWQKHPYFPSQSFTMTYWNAHVHASIYKLIPALVQHTHSGILRIAYSPSTTIRLLFTELRQCQDHEFMCRASHVCVYAERTCDGYPDCEDASDEELADCGQWYS